MVAGALSTWGLVGLIAFCAFLFAGVVALNRLANRMRGEKRSRRGPPPD
jgi:hypothetical protein